MDKHDELSEFRAITPEQWRNIPRLTEQDWADRLRSGVEKLDAAKAKRARKNAKRAAEATARNLPQQAKDVLAQVKP